MEAMPKWLDEVWQEEFRRLAPEEMQQGLLDWGNIIFFALGIYPPLS
jgi:hypothetical protein